MSMLIVSIYLIGFFVTWVIAFAMIYKGEMEDPLGGPVEIILLTGFLSLVIAMFWPVVLLVFGIFRIATYRGLR